MTSKTIALMIAMFVLGTVGYSQSGGMQIVMVDGSVRNTVQVEAEFPIAANPGQVRMRIAKLPATTLEACMASTDFSSARPMDRKDYLAEYDASTGIMYLAFGVEREMKESGEDGSRSVNNNSSCHVVRYGSGCCEDGRDFLMWQRNVGNAALFDGILTSENVIPLMQDGSVRFISYSVSGGF